MSQPLPLSHSKEDDPFRVCQDKFGVTPKEVQLEVIELIKDKKDCVLIAPTGWGKTLVYTLPLLLWPDAVFLIITPLKVLVEEQCKKLSDMGVKSINIVEGCNVTSANILAQKHRAIFLSPEMLLESERLNDAWKDQQWKESISAVIVDEAHCISTWGKEFRVAFGSLAKLRHKVHRQHTPYLAVSATLPSKTLAEVIKSLGMEDPKIKNVGSDRPNIMYKVVPFKNAMSSFEDLRFLADNVRTIVYFDKREQAETAGDYLQQWVGHGEVKVYHGFKRDKFKTECMREFRAGSFNILLATEATGMGCDIRDIVRVVQYGFPKDLNCLVQRLGRAARDPDIQGLGILLVPKQHGDLDQHLLGYVNFSGCRCQYLNKIYDTPHRHVDNCCDNCNPVVDTMSPESKPRKRVQRMYPHERHLVKEKLTTWRAKMYSLHYDYEDNMHDTEQSVMPDEVLERLVKKYDQITTLASMEIIRWNPLKRLFVPEVLSMVMELNNNFLKERNEKCEKQSKKQSNRKASFVVAPPQRVSISKGAQVPVSMTSQWQQVRLPANTTSEQQQVPVQATSSPKSPLTHEELAKELTWLQSLHPPPTLVSGSVDPNRTKPGNKSGSTPKQAPKGTARSAPLKELKIIQFFPKLPPKDGDKPKGGNKPKLGGDDQC